MLVLAYSSPRCGPNRREFGRGPSGCIPRVQLQQRPVPRYYTHTTYVVLGLRLVSHTRAVVLLPLFVYCRPLPCGSQVRSRGGAHGGVHAQRRRQGLWHADIWRHRECAHGCACLSVRPPACRPATVTIIITAYEPCACTARRRLHEASPDPSWLHAPLLMPHVTRCVNIYTLCTPRGIDPNHCVPCPLSGLPLLWRQACACSIW